MNVYLVRQWQTDTLEECLDDCYCGRTIHVFGTIEEARKCAATLNRLYAQGVILDKDDQYVCDKDDCLDLHYYDVESIEVYEEWEKTKIYRMFYELAEKEE